MKRSPRLGRHLFCSALIGTFTAAHAAETVLPSIEVIGVTPLPGIGLRVDQLPANVQRFDARELERSHDLTPAEFLDRSGGSVASNGASGNPFQIDLSYRGFAASPLLGTPQGLSVFLDGVRVNEPFGDVVNWDVMPMNALAEMVVVPGSNPVYGLNTLGGALVLTTRDGSAFPGTRASVTGGAFGRRVGSVEHGGAQGRVDWYMSGNALDEEGWREHSPSRLRQAFGKLRYRGDRDSVEATVNVADNRLQGTQALPLSMMDNPRQAYTWPDITGNRFGGITMRARHDFGETQEVTIQAHWRRLRGTSLNSNVTFNPDTSIDAPPAANVSSLTSSLTWGGSLQWSGIVRGALGVHRVTVGLASDLGATDFDQRNAPAVISDTREIIDAGPAALTVAARTDVRQTGLYALDAWELGERTTITLSARAQRAAVDIRDRSGMSPDLEGHHTFERVNPAVGATYRVDPATTLYASVSEGFRVPTAMELTCADPDAPCSLPNIFVADPALKAVVATTFETGARGRLVNAARWSATVYRTRLRDDIQFIATGSGSTNTGYFTNVGSTERAGAELNLAVPLGRARVSARYAYTRAIFLSGFSGHSAANVTADANGSIAVSPGNHIPGIPAHLLKLRVDVTPSPVLNAGIAIVAASSQYARGNENNADPAGRIGGYAVVNLDASWRPALRWQIDLTWSNVLDRKYQTFATLASNLFRGDNGSFAPALAQAEAFVGPAPPRAAWITVSHAFGDANH